MKTLLQTNNIPGFLLIRIILGYVFLVAGLQKFIFPDAMGPGRFLEMGFPAPFFFAYFVGVFEVIGGLFILIGFLTRFAAIPIIITMVVAIITTKLPQLADGFWGFAHALRLDLSMFLAAFFVLVNGADRRSLDHHLFGEKSKDIPVE